MLLAAGAGSRLGRRPKSLLQLDGEPLIQRLLRALRDAGVGEIVVVLGHHADDIAAALAGDPAAQVRNPDPDAGQVSSQRLGLAALAGAPSAVIVALADQPLIDAADIRRLIRAFVHRPPGAAVVYPQVDGERGNPVIFSAMVREQILAGGAGFGCRQWQAANPAAVAPFVAESCHYRIDIDTVDDLERLRRDTGHTLHWPEPLHTTPQEAPQDGQVRV